MKERPKDALKKHLKCAIEQYGAFKDPKSLLEIMEAYWDKYDEQKIAKPKLKENRNAKQIELCK